MKIELVIDELVLHGFDARHRHAIGDAVGAELTRLVQAYGKDLNTRGPMDVARLDAGTFEVPGRTPTRTGAAIAKSVFTAVRGAAS